MYSKIINNSILENIKHDLDVGAEKVIYENLHEHLNNPKKIYNSTNKLLDLKRANIEHKRTQLNNINDKLITRNRLINYTNDAIEEKTKKINILKKVYILFIIFLIIIVLYYTHLLDLSKSYMLAFFSIIIYFIYIIWSLNTLNIKNTSSPELEKIRAIVSAVGDKVYNEGVKLENEYKLYINQNCKSSNKKYDKDKDKDKEQNPDPGKADFDYENKVVLNDGSYYYDGTAPKERINPNIDEKRFAIEWEVNRNYGQMADNNLPKPAFFDNPAENEKVQQCNVNGIDQNQNEQRKYIDDYGSWTDNL